MTERGLPWPNVFYCYFVTIAVIIGTGILAIPVKLYDCGFTPFAVPFTVTMLTQIAMVFFLTELLQSAESLLSSRDDSSPVEPHGIAMSSLSKVDDEEQAVEEKPVSKTEPISLYHIGSLFLSPVLGPLFAASTVLHVSSVLVTYALAGSKATCQVLLFNAFLYSL